MMTTPRAMKLSEAQAKRLAGLFVSGFIAAGEVYVSPTDAAILKKGLVRDTGESGTYPNGNSYNKFIINDAGLFALERYLADVRMSKSLAGRAALSAERGRAGSHDGGRT
jgi:hypothetical protein